MEKKKELNFVAELILAVLEKKLGAQCGSDYFFEKHAELEGLCKSEILFWATRKLDSGNLVDLADRLRVDVDDLKAAGRVLRAIQ